MYTWGASIMAWEILLPLKNIRCINFHASQIYLWLTKIIYGIKYHHQGTNKIKYENTFRDGSNDTNLVFFSTFFLQLVKRAHVWLLEKLIHLIFWNKWEYLVRLAEKMERVFFYLYIAGFWWAFRGVIFCCLLINSYLCEEIFCVNACMYYIGATISHGDTSFF